jgi:hypothetical protein
MHTRVHNAPPSLVTWLPPGDPACRETEASTPMADHRGLYSRSIAEGLWQVSLHAVHAWTLRTSPDDVADNRGPFERLLGNA